MKSGRFQTLIPIRHRFTSIAPASTEICLYEWNFGLLKLIVTFRTGLYLSLNRGRRLNKKKIEWKQTQGRQVPRKISNLFLFLFQFVSTSRLDTAKIYDLDLWPWFPPSSFIYTQHSNPYIYIYMIFFLRNRNKRSVVERRQPLLTKGEGGKIRGWLSSISGQSINWLCTTYSVGS